MANLREQKKAETSARLLATARKWFFERGYAGTSMDDLCADAGVTRGALYHNFGSKEGLLEAVIRQIDAEVGDRLLEKSSDSVDPDSFIATCLAYLEAALDPEVRQIVFQDGLAVLGQRLRDIDQEGSVEPLREAIEELQKQGSFIDGDAVALAVLINGAMIDAALWIADADDTNERHKAASHALRSMLSTLSCRESRHSAIDSKVR
ncbi:TetR/AcrR family transcriptional regulator [Cognatiyoonia sp. IB215182]|uniref:TetR/AcrR family transcriptional regulator n=1 Tax=Cognatiyoonia sp. IB215182 TaxID=3097353 RepID=UPI002A0E1979|nr:TetR/AcrR family transcriptional regulator [Cognatiyoonia sp. IB215182]MDX8354855.1 TetR/AcrR family transcriptional regulator [Cognatiyoonia sp. IB215182]